MIGVAGGLRREDSVARRQQRGRCGCVRVLWLEKNNNYYKLGFIFVALVNSSRNNNILTQWVNVPKVNTPERSGLEQRKERGLLINTAEL